MPYNLLKLEPLLEQTFYEYANRDVPHHYFFILDWKNNRDETEIWLALEKNNIRGMMLIYRENIVHLRGAKPAVKALLSKLKLTRFELIAEPDHLDVVGSKYQLARKHELVLMTLRRGEEHLSFTGNVTSLTPDKAGEIADLMRSAIPEIWGGITSEKIQASMNRNLWLGVVINGRVVSTGNTFLTDPVSNIGAVATHTDYRNMGYATSVVSALVKQILQKNDLVLIHVKKNNAPARRVYEKVGFKAYRSYLFGFVGS